MKKLLFLLLLCNPSLFAAIAYQSANSAKDYNANTVTVSLTISGSNTYLVAGIAVAGTTMTLTSCVYNTTETLSLISTQLSGGNRTYLYGRVAPTTGTHNLVCTFSGTDNWKIVGAVNYTGVHQTTPLGTATGAVDGDTTVTTNVSTAVGDMAVDAVQVNDSPALTVPAPQVERVINIQGTDLELSMSEELAVGTSVTMSRTWTGSAYCSIVAVPLKAAAAASSVAPILLSQKRRRQQ